MNMEKIMYKINKYTYKNNEKNNEIYKMKLDLYKGLINKNYMSGGNKNNNKEENDIKKIMINTISYYLRYHEILDKYTDKDLETTVTGIIKNFKENYPNYDFDKLVFKRISNTSESDDNDEKVSIFYYNDDENIIFKFFKTLWRIKEDMKFRFERIDKICLKPDSDPIGSIHDSFVPVLISTDCKKIAFELYPFEDRVSFDALGYDKKLSKLIKTVREDNEIIKINDMYTLKIGSDDNGIIYEIFNGDKRIGGFIDEAYTYQLGDGHTRIYLHDNKNILIENNGDVSSNVVIKNLFEC
jgi:hypothetical protein